MVAAVPRPNQKNRMVKIAAMCRCQDTSPSRASWEKSSLGRCASERAALGLGRCCGDLIVLLSCKVMSMAPAFGSEPGIVGLDAPSVVLGGQVGSDYDQARPPGQERDDALGSVETRF